VNSLDIWAKPISQLLDRGGGGLILFEFEHLTERGCFLVYVVFLSSRFSTGSHNALPVGKSGKEKFEYFALICTLF
jgi:hypothetical protein